MLYVWTMRFIDVSTVAVLGETWLVFFVVTMLVLFPKRGGGLPWKWLVCLLLLSAAGASLVVAAQAGGLSLFSGEGAGDLFVGFGLVFLWLLGSAVPGPVFLWGAEVGRSLSAEVSGNVGPVEVAMVSTVLATVAGQLAVAAFSMGASWGLGLGNAAGASFRPEQWLLTLVAGALISGPGIVLFRAANCRTSNFGVNPVAYFQPVFALMFLAFAGRVSVPRVDYLVYGTVLIVVANVLLQLGTVVVPSWRLGVLTAARLSGWRARP